jgi:hypothetical protein
MATRFVRVEHDDAVAEIASSLPANTQLVRLDGFMCVGKSCLARQLAVSIDGVVIDGDDFASPADEDRPYVECLALDRLRSAITEHFNRRTVVLAAVCSREVFPPPGDLSEFRVYLKRMSFNTPEWPYWHHNPDVEEPPNRMLERSIHEYHLKHRPHETSDLVLEIPEEGDSLLGPLTRF